VSFGLFLFSSFSLFSFGNRGCLPSIVVVPAESLSCLDGVMQCGDGFCCHVVLFLLLEAVRGSGEVVVTKRMPRLCYLCFSCDLLGSGYIAWKRSLDEAVV